MFELKVKQVASNPFNVTVPAVNVRRLVAVIVSCNDQPPPTPLNVTAYNDLPAEVMVLPVAVAANVIVPVPVVQVMPATAVNEPAMVVAAAGAKVPLNPVKFRSCTQLAVVIATILPAAPAVTDTFGAVVALPPVVPMTTVLVMALAAAPVNLNPPAPVGVKPVAVVISNTVAVAVVVMLM